MGTTSKIRKENCRSKLDTGSAAGGFGRRKKFKHYSNMRRPKKELINDKGKKGKS